MFKGLGIDIVDIARMGKVIEGYGPQFLQKVYTPSEIAWFSAKAFPKVHFAGRWAAKEAFYKALPDRLQALSGWKSIRILPDSAGRRPLIEICDERLRVKLEREQVVRFHLSISHEKSH